MTNLLILITFAGAFAGVLFLTCLIFAIGVKLSGCDLSIIEVLKRI